MPAIERNFMGKTELVKSGQFYTYGHYLDGNLIYIGEGKGYRAWEFSKRSYRDHRDQVEVRIFGVFDSKELAVFNEGLLIYQERMEGNEHLLNKSDYGTGQTGCKASDETRRKLSEANFGKTGEQSATFKGLSIGKNQNNQIIVFCGKKDMSSRGFFPGNISDVINGNRPHHKKFTFTRSTDPIYLQQLLDTAEFFDDVSRSRIEEFLTK